MKAGGWTIKPTEKEDLFMPMEMSMMDSGWMIKLMDLESIVILMVPNTKVTGKKINNMETVLKHGQMDQATRDNTNTAKNMDRERSLGKMVVHSLAILSITISKV